jgi:hypothetical protein
LGCDCVEVVVGDNSGRTIELSHGLRVGGALGATRAKRAGQRSRSVREDWFAWIPNEMDHLFDATRAELESYNDILCISIDDALSLCKSGQYDSARDRAIVIAGLFDRLAARVCHVIETIKHHGSHFGIVPNVSPLSASNFRGADAQRRAVMNTVLAKVLFRERSRFFHKLSSLDEIIEVLRKEVRETLTEISAGTVKFPQPAWNLLEILCYDLSTCMGETTILLKSFFCALPPEELATFRQKLVNLAPPERNVTPGRMPSFECE